jgi:hypothetical protein
METLEELNAYDPESFEVWLDRNFQALYGADTDRRHRAFDFRHLGIPSGESHVDRLQELYAKLSVSAQRSFREAVEALFRHAIPDSFPAAAMADLLLISGLLKAFRVLRSFGPVLGTGPWGELHKSLIYDALSVLLMFSRTDEAYDSAKALATSVNFPDAYVLDTYLILVRSRPQNWVDDLALFRQRFASLARRIERSEDLSLRARLERRLQNLADSVAQDAPLSDLAPRLPDLKVGPYEPNDDWLVDALLARSGKLRLEYSSDGETLLLIDRMDPTRQAAVPSDPGFTMYCIKKGLLLPTFASWHVEQELSPEALVRLQNCQPQTETAYKC